jgi:hypothetical protein
MCEWRSNGPLMSPTLAEKGVELAGALFWFWTKRGLFEEGQHWLEQALAVHGQLGGSVKTLSTENVSELCILFSWLKRQ